MHLSLSPEGISDKCAQNDMNRERERYRRTSNWMGMRPLGTGSSRRNCCWGAMRLAMTPNKNPSHIVAYYHLDIHIEHMYIYIYTTTKKKNIHIYTYIYHHITHHSRSLSLHAPRADLHNLPGLQRSWVWRVQV